MKDKRRLNRRRGNDRADCFLKLKSFFSRPPSDDVSGDVNHGKNVLSFLLLLSLVSIFNFPFLDYLAKTSWVFMKMRLFETFKFRGCDAKFASFEKIART